MQAKQTKQPVAKAPKQAKAQTVVTPAPVALGNSLGAALGFANPIGLLGQALGFANPKPAKQPLPMAPVQAGSIGAALGWPVAQGYIGQALGFGATVQPAKGKRVANSQPKAPTGQRVKVLGAYSIYATAQWAAQQGYSYGNIMAAFNQLVGQAATAVNVKTAITDSKNPKYSRPAQPTAQHAAQLVALLSQPQQAA